MQSISINIIKAFDAYYDKIITFNYSGNQSIKNRLTVYENTTNEIVYNEETTTFRLSHTIPSNSLANGYNYSCTITAYDIDGNSITSSKMPFVCLSTPVWEFTNIISDQIIRNSSYIVNIIYDQVEDELLNEYKIILYTSGMSVLWDSGIRYDSSLSTNLVGLVDNTRYYIRALGETVNGFSLDTGYIPFSVEFEYPSLYAVIIPENKKHEGQVKITSNIIAITGTSNLENVDYVFDDLVDLRTQNSFVTFNEGFKLNNNFLISFIGFGFSQNKEILLIGDDDVSPKIYWRKSDFNNKNNLVETRVFAELKIDEWPEYVIFSNHILEPKKTDMIHFWVRCVNGLYEIKIANIAPENVFKDTVWGALKNITWGELKEMTSDKSVVK